jgi:hypothetical protein
VPLWAAILIGLTGGLVGVLARISNDRGAELRGRMLEAADEFIATAIPALIDLNEVAPTILSRDSGGAGITVWGAKPPEQSLPDIRAAVKALELELARVHLLFGAESPTGMAAREVTSALRDANNVLTFIDQLAPVLPDEEKELLRGAHTSFNEYQRAMHRSFDRFGPAARRALIPWWRPWERPALLDGSADELEDDG